MRTSIVVVLITVLAIGVFATMRMRSSDLPRSAMTGVMGCSDSTQIVTIRFSEGAAHDLHIPANYLGYPENLRGGSQPRIRINASYPSLAARPVGGVWASCASSADPTKWGGDRLEIMINGSNYGFHEEMGEYLEMPSEVPGFRHLARKCVAETPAGSAPVRGCRQEHGFLPLTPQSHPHQSIQCFGMLIDENASCDGFFEHDGIQVRVSFGRSRLPEFEQVTVAAKALLTKFASHR